MTRDDIIQQALEAGAYWEHGDFNMPIPVGFYNEKDLIIFAQMIAAHEREACALVCEEYENDMGYGQPQKCADAIRARGKA
jgi:hypothetical protein